MGCKKGAQHYHTTSGDMVFIMFNTVLKEPVEQDTNNRWHTCLDYTDISIRELWKTQIVALLDVCVVDTDATSYIHKNVKAVLSSVEKSRKGNNSAVNELVQLFHYF